MDTTNPTVHVVGIAVKGVPTYVLDVPTYQGRDVAERRARWMVLANDHSLEPEDVTVCPAE